MQKPHSIPVITIDGPSGTGKGTISWRLAQHFSWHYLDSGALYRALAVKALKEGVDLHNEVHIAKLAEQLDLRFDIDTAFQDSIRVFLEDIDITDKLRTEESGNAASTIAVYVRVRNELVALQHHFRQPPGLIADGRDMGTVIFPDAKIKIYLEASPEERAKRRYNQLKEKGIDVNLAHLSEEIAGRDARDRQRPVAPLKPAIDATIIDTTGSNIDTVFAQVLQCVNKKLA